MQLTLAVTLLTTCAAFNANSFGVRRSGNTSSQLNALFGDNLEAALDREVSAFYIIFSIFASKFN